MDIASNEAVPTTFDLQGWKDIAAAAHMSISSAKDASKRAQSPLPVYLLGERKTLANRAQVTEWLHGELRRPATRVA